VSFTFDRRVAERFKWHHEQGRGAEVPGVISEIEVLPGETYGALSTTGELEVLVPTKGPGAGRYRYGELVQLKNGQKVRVVGRVGNRVTLDRGPLIPGRFQHINENRLFEMGARVVFEAARGVDDRAAMRAASRRIRGRAIKAKRKAVPVSKRLRSWDAELGKRLASDIRRGLAAQEGIVATAQRVQRTDTLEVDVPQYIAEIAAEAKASGPGVKRAAKAHIARLMKLEADGAAKYLTNRVNTRQFMRKIQKAHPDDVDALVEEWVQRKAVYRARVIARHETVEAFRQSHIENSKSHPRLRGFQWALSNRHPRPDICDVHVAADVHGLGPGIYKADSIPDRHPMCLCTLSAVYDDPENPQELNPEVSHDEALARMPEAQRREILGPTRMQLFNRGHRVVRPDKANLRRVRDIRGFRPNSHHMLIMDEDVARKADEIADRIMANRDPGSALREKANEIGKLAREIRRDDETVEGAIIRAAKQLREKPTTFRPAGVARENNRAYELEARARYRAANVVRQRKIELQREAEREAERLRAEQNADVGEAIRYEIDNAYSRSLPTGKGDDWLPNVEFESGGDVPGFHVTRDKDTEPELVDMVDAVVVSRKPLGGGHVNPAYKVELFTKDRRTIYAAFKAHETSDHNITSDSWSMKYAQAPREEAAYRVDQMLGENHVVPPSVVAEVDMSEFGEGLQVGSLQRWEGGDQAAEYYDSLVSDWGSEDVREGILEKVNIRDLERLAVVDAITGNTDRHGNNFLIDRAGHINAIDNGLSFPRESDSRSPRYNDFHRGLGAAPWVTDEISPGLLEKVRALDEEKLDKMLYDMDIEREARKAAIIRLKHLKRNGRIAPGPGSERWPREVFWPDDGGGRFSNTREHTARIKTFEYSYDDDLAIDILGIPEEEIQQLEEDLW
jgi:hypothetical protein